MRYVMSLAIASPLLAFAAEDHWAFQPLQRPHVPLADQFSTARNPIDHFVNAKLREQSLAPSPEAQRHQLIRRLALDLTGLPPRPAAVREFAKDTHPGAYERLVTRLLASPRFGETMAVTWMDAARYGDSGAMHADRDRAVWAWRDYVINAFNANKAFDEFTIEQLAGDLLPNATFEQLVASAFNRHHPTSNEAGSIAEELRVEYVADRVDTTATVWLGLTLDCARCHDHKYDPISQRDYYRFFAYFNNTTDPGIQDGDARPTVHTFTDAERKLRPELHQRIAALSAVIREYKGRHADRAKVFWERMHPRRHELVPEPDDLLVRVPFPGAGRSLATASSESHTISVPTRSDQALSVHLQMKLPQRSTGILLSRQAADDSRRGFSIALRHGKLVFRLVRDWPGNLVEVVTANFLPLNVWTSVTVSYPANRNRSDCRIFVDGKPVSVEVVANSLTGDFETSEPLIIGADQNTDTATATLAEARIYARPLSKNDVVQLTPAFRVALSKAPQQRSRLEDTMLAGVYYRRYDPNIRDQVTELDRRLDQLDALLVNADQCLVMREREQRRPTYVLDRGNYRTPLQDETLTASVPGFLDFAVPNKPNRLGLARWLVHPDNPLTARVTVNWLWQKFFGRGLVSTPADFGVRGAAPSHPELLDWLAAELIESDWDLRHLIRLMVQSHTYRQSARHRTMEDPDNVWLSRSTRLRLPAETVRDQALALSGLLVERFGGRSAKPYQPPNIWSEVHRFPDIYYFRHQGEGLYRRSVYTFWHRSAPLPNMMIFDAPTRERCTMKRSRTNTPLQALVTLNDEQFVEAARGFAQSIIRLELSADERLRYAFHSATARVPTASELGLLRELLAEQLEHYRRSPSAADDLLRNGDSKIPGRIDHTRLAAWTILCQVLLNLDEVLQRN